MADIKNLTLLPRPRSAWQAMDAGFTLARAHFPALAILWLLFSVPVFLVTASLELWLRVPFLIFIWWWFKPLYELPMHFYLSRALFAEPITIKAACKLTFSHFWLLFRTYLTVSRLSGKRSLSYAVVFLEKLPRKQRAKRIETLTMVTTRHLLLLMVCLHIEIFLTYSLIVLFGYLFLPDAASTIDWVAFFTGENEDVYAPYLTALSFFSVVAGALVAPFYVAGGFIIYINRRMHLEAWDIEHRFRSITPRNRVGLASILLVLLCFAPSDRSIAENRAQLMPSQPEVEASLLEVMAKDDFGVTKTRKVPVFNFDEKEEEEEEDKLNQDFIDWMKEFAQSVAGFLKLVIWGAAILFAILLIYTIVKFKRSPKQTGNALERGSRDGEDAKSHPLTQDLPLDIVGTAERLLQQGERRKALSVLFRGALRAIMTEYELKIASGATESDCKRSVSAVANNHQSKTFSNLVGVWQREAYANQPQQEQLIKTLIDDWRHAFGGTP